MSTKREQLAGYRLLLRLLSPLLLLHTAWQAREHRDKRFWRERRGYYADRPHSRPIWLHAASVGELNGLLPLIETLHRHHPELPLLLTTATPSSGELAGKKLPPSVQHVYLPIDWPGAVGRFYNQFRPSCALIMETELWPNLYATAKARRIPLFIVNGRVSRKTLKAPAWVRRLYDGCLRDCTAIFARSEQDRLGFIALGANAERIRVIGNLKFAARPPPLAAPVDLGRPYILAASTRDGEERLVAEAWRPLVASNCLLVIAPRHPQRRERILRDLRPYNLNIAVRSQGDTIQADSAVYLADTFGELTAFMAGAEFVYIGGSLVAKGGQNLLEPAALGKATICGPHMDNFADETRLLLENNAVLMVQDSASLTKAMQLLLVDLDKRQSTGSAARSVVDTHKDMAERYYQALVESCPEALSPR